LKKLLWVFKYLMIDKPARFGFFHPAAQFNWISAFEQDLLVLIL